MRVTSVKKNTFIACSQTFYLGAFIMSSVNRKAIRPTVKTHGGAKTYSPTSKEQLRRAVTSYMLWEDQFYENGIKIADRISDLISKVSPDEVYQLAIDARTKFKLRHVPLFLARVMASLPDHKGKVAKLLPEIIQRPDELTEFLSIYWKDGKCPLSAQVKKGLSKAFRKFNEYSLAKYNRDGKSVKLRDVLFLTHAKPMNKEQELLWKKLIADELETPDTWEVEMSAKGNNKDSWERLLREKKLGALALIRNLRNMTEKSVDGDLIKSAINEMDVSRVLPFRFITAAKHAARWEPELEKALFRCTEGLTKLPGKTVLVVDVSGSMYNSGIAKYSEMDRARAACALAMLVREMCEEPIIYATAGNDGTRVHKTELVPARRGFALSDGIYNMCRPLGGGGIFLKQVMNYIKPQVGAVDRVIVITDEQDCDVAGSPNDADAFGKHNYIINVASCQNGIAYGKFVHISGFSEAVLSFISQYEQQQ